MRLRPAIFFVLTAAAIWFGAPQGATDANAASRVAHFSASGRSETTGVRNSLVAECTITITNPSTVSQQYTVNATKIRATNSSGTFSAGYHGNATAINSPCVSSCALAAGSTTVIVYQYPAFTTEQVGEAHLVCEGNIQASDSAAGTQGFLIANGTLSTFMPTTSANFQQGVNVRTIRASVSFSHLQLLIGEGRPF